MIDDRSTEFRSLRNRSGLSVVCIRYKNIVEKSIEEVLIGGVVQRFRKDIQTQDRLHRLSEITKEDCDMIDQLMTKYSYYDHAMADEAPLIELSYGELEADLTQLQSWIKNHKQ